MEFKLSNKFREDLNILVKMAKLGKLFCPKARCRDCIMCEVLACCDMAYTRNLSSENIEVVMSTTKIKIKGGRVYIYGKRRLGDIEFIENEMLEWFERNGTICKL